MPPRHEQGFNSIPATEDEKVREKVRSVLEGSIRRMLLHIPEKVVGLEEQKEFLARRFEGDVTVLWPEGNDAQEFMTGLRSMVISSIESLPHEVSQYVSESLLRRYSPQELEQKLRENSAEKNGWILVNEALSYEIAQNEVALHVPALFTKGPSEMILLFAGGLKTLAQKIANEPDLSRITEIMGKSWIAFEHPALMVKMGFTVTERDEEWQTAVASMSREDFLERYGN